MIKIIKLIFIIFLVFAATYLLISCKYKDSKNENVKYSGNLDLEKIRLSKDFYELFEEKKVIKFRGETIGSIIRLKVLPSNNFGILESSSKHILIFDSLGNYKNTIGGNGEGPGEYLYGTDFVSYKNDLILVLDPTLMRVQCFSESGEYKWMFKIQYPKEHMVIADYKLFLFSTLNMLKKPSGSCYDLVSKTKEFDFAYPTSFLSHLIDNGNISLSAISNSIEYCDNEIFLINPYQPVIRRFSNEGNEIQVIRADSKYFVSYDSSLIFNPALINPKKYFISFVNGLQVWNNLIFLSYANKEINKLFLDIYSLSNNTEKVNQTPIPVPSELFGGNNFFPLEIDNKGNFLISFQPEPNENKIQENPVVIKYKFKFMNN